MHHPRRALTKVECLRPVHGPGSGTQPHGRHLDLLHAARTDQQATAWYALAPGHPDAERVTVRDSARHEQQAAAPAGHLDCDATELYGELPAVGGAGEQPSVPVDELADLP